MLLYYIRHGDPVYEPDSLTALGHRQAEAVARRLALHGMDKIYCSSSNRTVLTAQPLCELQRKEPTKLDWCREDHAFHYLHVTGADGKKTWGLMEPEIKRLFISKELADMGHKWTEHPALKDTNFREGVEVFGREVDNFLAAHGYERHDSLNCYKAVRPSEERIALFAHWGAGGLIMSHILDIPYPQFASRFTMGHTCVTVVEFRDVDGLVIPKVISYSNDSHFYREGLPTKFVNRIYI